MTIKIKKENKGRLHKDLGIKEDKKIPIKKMEEARKNATPAEKKRIVFAENARKWHKKGK